MSTKITWEEPVEFFRAYIKSTGTLPTRRQQFVAGIIAAAVVAGLAWGFEWFFYWLHKKDLGVPAYFYVVAPLIAGLFVFFLVPMLMSISATIVLNEKGIHRNKAIGTHLVLEHWPWESISKLAIEDIRYGDSVFRVMVVRSDQESADILIGLGDAPLEQIYDFAVQMGKTPINRVGKPHAS
jgi:hypothetical protein